MESTTSPALQPPALVAERIARYRATFDHHDLWPETTAAERSGAYQGLLEATRSVLRGAGARLEGRGPRAVRAAGIAAFVSGMGGLLGRWIEQGRLRADPEIARLLLEHLAHARGRAALMNARMELLVAALARRGVVPVVLKGMHTAHRYFNDPGCRPTTDVDLLVLPGELVPAREALGDAGLEVRDARHRPQREEWGLPGESVVHSLELQHAENPWGIDLHGSLDRRYFRGRVAGLGTPDASGLREWKAPFGPVSVLGQPLLTAHLALNAGADLPNVQLVRIVELIEVMSQDLAAGRLDRAALRECLRRTGTRRFAYPAFELAARLSPDAVEPSLREDLARSVTPRMRRVVARAACTLPYHGARRSLDEKAVWAHGPGELTRNLLELLTPTGRDNSISFVLRVWYNRLRLLASGRLAWKEPPTGPRG